MYALQTTNRYQLERDIESVTTSSRYWLKERFKEVLESDKESTRKCDYLGYSILNIDAKLTLLDEEIKELRILKEHLKSAKELALEVGAELLGEYGIAKLEGMGISSISVYQPMHQSKLTLSIINETILMEAGFVKRVVDVEAIKEAYLSGQYKELIQSCCAIERHESAHPKRLKINKRRSANTTHANTEEEKAS